MHSHHSLHKSACAATEQTESYLICIADLVFSQSSQLIQLTAQSPLDLMPKEQSKHGWSGKDLLRGSLQLHRIKCITKPISEHHQNFLSGISNAHTAEQVLCCSSGICQGETGFNRVQGTWPRATVKPLVLLLVKASRMACTTPKHLRHITLVPCFLWVVRDEVSVLLQLLNK